MTKHCWMWLGEANKKKSLVFKVPRTKEEKVQISSASPKVLYTGRQIKKKVNCKGKQS